MVMLLALVACTPVTIEPDLASCTNVDPDDPEPSELVVTVDGDAARIVRTYEFLDGTNLTWDPVIATEGKVVHIYESWSGEADGAACYEPGVTITPVRGNVQVRWYLSPDDTVPWDTIEVSKG